ncbi:2-polyprenyl-3-methyl-6-methoxy-1,4-benzoquinone monooxygenase [Gammaproteobacteria bacterium]|jgi:ubiquinone biosynthesis monooxygenase Coq7|nr:2-polyprenyl-3-methyl-6-methoxy-1,4-benzoquinone monooxygenase [Gammaproteobacteria bacterium]
MSERDLTPLDQLLAGIDNALRTVASPVGRSARQNPAGDIPAGELDPGQRQHSAGLMRVNHAGEIAAQGLYQGHAAVARSPEIEEQMQRAATEELDHLAWCEQRLSELDSRPSRLSPLWYAGSFAIGAASGVLGDRWSLGFIAETENQVCEHLSAHLDRLPERDARSRAIVERMREEEKAHGEDAVNAGAADLPLPIKRLMRLTAKVMTTTAYRL